MNHSQYFTSLSLPSIILSDDILHRSDETPYEVSQSEVNPYIIDLLSSKGFGISNIEVFKTGKQNKRWVVHVDGIPDPSVPSPYGDLGKLNWVYGNLECHMKWFKELEPTSQNLQYNNVGPYIQYSDNDVQEIASFNIGKMAIVQAGIPHTLVNDSDVDRYCVSIHLSHSSFRRVPYAFLKHNFSEFCV